MKKNDLLNGDFVVLKNGQIGLVILNGDDGYLVYANNAGWEALDDFNDELVHEYFDDAVMQVFRGIRGYNEIEDDEPILEREETWVRHSETDLAKRTEEGHLLNEKLLEKQTIENVHKNCKLITIVSQAFYGNRTGTEIHAENIDRFILGYLDDFPVSQPIDRTIVHVPGSEELVLIYNKFSEEKRLEDKKEALEKDNYVIKPLATVPELNLEIYSRCIACRMPTDGVFESLEEEDYILLEKYLAY